MSWRFSKVPIVDAEAKEAARRVKRAAMVNCMVDKLLGELDFGSGKDLSLMLFGRVESGYFYTLWIIEEHAGRARGSRA